MGRKILAVFPGASFFRTGGQIACAGYFILPASQTGASVCDVRVFLLRLRREEHTDD